MTAVQKLNEQYADKIDQETDEWIGTEEEYWVYFEKAFQLAMTAGKK